MAQYQELLSSGFHTQVRHVQSADVPTIDVNTGMMDFGAMAHQKQLQDLQSLPENPSADELASYVIAAAKYFGSEDCWDFLATKDGETVGWSRPAEIIARLVEGDSFGPVYPIELSQVIASDTPLFEAAASLLKRDAHRLWVLQGNQITATFSYFDLLKLPGVLCLFGLTIELEMAALELCRCFLKQCWGALPEGRQAKAVELWHKRTDRDASRRDERLDRSGSAAYYEGLIECTTFIDKATMIHKCKLVIDTGGNKLSSIFNRAEEVRNACAHPAENDRLQSLLPLDKYVAFVMDCRKLIDSIRMVTVKK